MRTNQPSVSAMGAEKPRKGKSQAFGSAHMTSRNWCEATPTPTARRAGPCPAVGDCARQEEDDEEEEGVEKDPARAERTAEDQDPERLVHQVRQERAEHAGQDHGPGAEAGPRAGNRGGARPAGWKRMNIRPGRLRRGA